jgi:hypothetical protein
MNNLSNLIAAVKEGAMERSLPGGCKRAYRSLLNSYYLLSINFIRDLRGAFSNQLGVTHQDVTVGFQLKTRREIGKRPVMTSGLFAP